MGTWTPPGRARALSIFTLLTIFTTLCGPGLRPDSSLHAASCGLHPIAVHLHSVQGSAPGTLLPDLFNGAGAGHFGWLSWNGSPSTAALAASLLPPGNSSNYINPDDPLDRSLSPGDWVHGRPGVANAHSVRAALDQLLNLDLILPVWDEARGAGDKLAYRVAGFIHLRLLSYHLGGENRLSALYLGLAGCDQLNLPPAVQAGSDQAILLEKCAPLQGTVSDDGLPALGTLTHHWTQLSGPAPASFTDASALATEVCFPEPGLYQLELTASDGELSASDRLTITVNLPNRPPEAHSMELDTDEDTPLEILLSGADPDGDALSFQILFPPAYGTLSGAPPQLLYTPLEDFHGKDWFTFRVNDGILDSAPATVWIAIHPVNDPPTADDQSVLTGRNQPVVIVLSGADVEGSELSFRITRFPAHGLLSGEPPELTYTPNPGFHGADSFQFVAHDGELDSPPATIWIEVSPLPDLYPIPPDPSGIAPAWPGGAGGALIDQVAFLFQGSPPIQYEVLEEALDPLRLAVLRGRVKDPSGRGLSGVKVQIERHPEFGFTLSREDGAYDLAVNGGGWLAVSFSKEGYLPAQRLVQPRWQEFAPLEPVALVELDPHFTVIQAPAPEWQSARGSVVSDADGARQATLLFAPGTAAWIEDAEGMLAPLPSLSVRATEYTVGPQGLEAMPAPLPANSAYTYCVELSADEALQTGARAVRFNQPVYLYLENFLDFPTGSPVPAGYFERSAAPPGPDSLWVPSTNGRILTLLEVQQGLAVLDLEGNGTPADGPALAGLGFTAAELALVAQLYAPGQSLWRVPIPHFTPWDLNWPMGPPADARPPQAPPPRQEKNDDDDCEGRGSIIEITNQILKEHVALPGVPFELVYASDRTVGRTASRSLEITLSQEDLPESLEGIQLELRLAGQVITQSFPALPGQTVQITWDGLDAYGRRVQGGITGQVGIGYVYRPVYYAAAELEASFARFSDVPMTGSWARRELILWQWQEVSLGGFNARPLHLGGWQLEPHHFYDLNHRRLHLGNGERHSAHSLSLSVQTVAGNLEVLGLSSQPPGDADDGQPALWANLNGPPIVAAAPDGSFYVVDTHFNTGARVRQVARDGTIRTIAGGGDGSGWPAQTGEGGPATQAFLRSVSDLAFAPDGSLYLADPRDHRVLRIAPDGILDRVAGRGYISDSGGFSGDGGPAREAELSFPTTLALTPEGSLFIGDYNNHRVRHVTPDGIILTVAGNGQPGFAGDGGPASQAELVRPLIALGRQGELYIASINRIRRLAPDGTIQTVIGGGTHYLESGLPASQALFGSIEKPGVAPDGAVYFADSFSEYLWKVRPDGVALILGGHPAAPLRQDGRGAMHTRFHRPTMLVPAPDGSLLLSHGGSANHVVRRIASPLPGFSNEELALASPDGSLLHAFDRTGRHLWTLDALTFSLVHEFVYDQAGLLRAVRDPFGNTTMIERDAGGQPRAIIGPYGARTLIELDLHGFLAALTAPDGTRLSFQHDPDGLLRSLTSPGGLTTWFDYDSQGRLQRDSDPAGGFSQLTRTPTPSGRQVALSTALGRTTFYERETLDTGVARRWITAPDGSQTLAQKDPDGRTTLFHPDGGRLTASEGPHALWGLQVPVPSTLLEQTPAGLVRSSAYSESAGFDPADPARLLTYEQALSVEGRQTTGAYDATARTLTVQSPLGRLTTAALDEHSRLTAWHSPSLDPVHFAYDERGRLATLSQGTGPQTRTLAFAYNPQGYLHSVTDPAGRTVHFAYDPSGRLVEQQLPGGRTARFAYDAQGRLSALAPPEGQWHQFTYSPVNLLTGYFPPAAGLPLNHVQLEYNSARQLTALGRPDGVALEFEYDQAGRLSAIQSPAGPLRLAYDQPDCGCAGPFKPSSLSTPEGATLAFQYDGVLLKALEWSGTIAGSVSGEYDPSYRLSGLRVNGAGLISFAYDADDLLEQAGELSILRRPESGHPAGSMLHQTTDSMVFNGFAELESYAAHAGSQPLLLLHFTRDPLGRIVEKAEWTGAASGLWQYGYHPSGWLSEVRLNGVTLAAYEYDPNGNRLRAHREGIEEIYYYDEQDRLLERSQPATGSTVRYTYTAHGELTGREDNGALTQYQYDPWGNLRRVRLPEGTELEYLVDGLNRRIGKKRNGALVQGFLYQDQLNPIAELDGTGAVRSRFVYGLKAHVPDYLVRQGETFRILTDQLGSPRLVVHAQSGAIAQEIHYDEFGQVLFDSNPGFQPFGFAGGLYDPESGLVRYGARDYDPQTGRWTAKDPVLFFGGDANVYTALSNDPVNRIDPTGLVGVQIGGLMIGRGDPNLVFDKQSWFDLQAGAAATFDGLIPFFNPFQSHYDPCDVLFQASRRYGKFGRNMLTFAGGGAALKAVARSAAPAGHFDKLAGWEQIIASRGMISNMITSAAAEVGGVHGLLILGNKLTLPAVGIYGLADFVHNANQARLLTRAVISQ